MPVEHAGFMLKPANFFDANPGLDIPLSRNAASREHGTVVAACSVCGSKGHTGRNPHPHMHTRCAESACLPPARRSPWHVTGFVVLVFVLGGQLGRHEVLSLVYAY